MNNICLQLVKIEAKTKFHSWKGQYRNEQYKPTLCQDRSENEFSPKLSKIENETHGSFLNFWRSKRKQIGLVNQFMRAKEIGTKVIQRAKRK